MEGLAALAPDAKRITDKMTVNFLFAGLIHLALPNAIIIHAVRDPRDTCVSCFSVHFTSQQEHTYDLAELGRFTDITGTSWRIGTRCCRVDASWTSITRN